MVEGLPIFRNSMRWKIVDEKVARPISSVYIKPRTSPMLRTSLRFILLGVGILMQGKELHSKVT